MKVIVFGATGKTGQHALRAALAAGHEVTAFGRSVDRIDIDDPALETHKGDVFDTDSVTGAVAGHDAAIVCLGSTGLRDKTGSRSHEARVYCFAPCFATCSTTTKHRKPSSHRAH